MTLSYRVAGTGTPLLLIHGAAEDASMLAPQAEAFAARGRRVIWYDRRGTGASSRADWPEGGVAQHVADAAELLRSLDAVPATVLGFSSGGVIALELAARHPELVERAIAWEPAAITALPDGADLHASILVPLDAQLAAQPGDWRAAFAVLIELMSGGAADLSSPEVQAQMVNAEAAVRDDARIITRHEFAPGSLPAGKVAVAIGKNAAPMHVAIAERLTAEVGAEPIIVEAADDHEVYLSQPDVLADALG
ncbi:alpha/beta fold hydrolase [Tenggerimyces flavus]|uniref:Alpha/beta fold hydrolase n=1 Tax=Tenggerimyces flavus TaxID=1708749 RepID=A0ABV7YAT9_9ACTN|nr:alpha/beta fold hydrolase [Tenggerimyces flavus]MBM7785224.1 pimeloyl-ACP methyl ester carboxylesterase [Tenggerimyces flavus]